MPLGSRLLVAPLAALLASTAVAATPVPPAPDSTAAVVGKTVIPWSAVETAAADELARAARDHTSSLRRLELQTAVEHAKIIDGAVDRLLDDRVLALEAVATRTSTDQLRAKLKVAAVTDDDLRAFYAERKQQIGQPFEAVAGQIRTYLESEAQRHAERDYLTTLRIKYHAESRLEPWRLEVAADGPARGPADAPVTVVEFGDFQCPYCAQMEPVLKRLAAAYPTQLRLVFRHLPLVSIHPRAADAARASVCADRQGHFWDLHDAFYANQSALAPDGIRATAARLGLDMPAFEHCFGSDEPEAKVVADSAAADVLGLGGTPAFFVNGRFISGTSTLEVFKAVVDDELARKASASALH